MPLLENPEHLEGRDMTKIQDIGMYTEPKTTTKQIPLFEEEDDGNLIPYVREQ